MDNERKNKEYGTKLYKLLVHSWIIFGLYLMNEKLKDEDNFWIVIAFLVFYFIMKLCRITRLEIAAKNEGITLSEYIEKLKKEEEAD